MSGSGQYTFDTPDANPHFPTIEEKILAYWREIDAFQESLRQSAGKKPYVFYDGPPFATGLPHYGHILAGTIKDVVTRYAHQRGYHVDRRFGWDCHGLPIEYEIDKDLGIKGRQDVLDMGIGNYNEECRKIVQRYTGEWRTIVERFGRWVDFDNDYRTMDLTFMESVWWVFKSLYDKGMVYRAFRVMPFSTACNTSLSNFEVSQNYKEVSDPSIIVRFKVVGEEDTWLLAWTTTPWTLPSNLALCVNPGLTYLRVRRGSDGQTWLCGKDRWQWICSSIQVKNVKKEFEVLEEFPGTQLVGTEYIPLFDYFQSKVIKEKVWRVVSDGYVSTEAGTCIVHQAPAFGEDDYRVCLQNGIILRDGTGMVCPVDDSGIFSSDVQDFQGQHVKAADKDIKTYLKDKGNLLFNGTEVHNYPHCWRSDTPLIYKAVSSWFVKVEEAREKLIANNNKTHWVPKAVQEKRFHNWLCEARDWCVSRTRYWGAPIPLWVSSDFEEVVCIGSVAELEKYAGRKITDIHRHFIDDIEIPSKQGKGMLRRVDEVFDCWFESGSMPYAQVHYPFEDKEKFEQCFPAQFIAEGLDQTRGWFYTLMVLSTHLFDQPPFQNLIVNGLVLAADGKKMSKRLRNYPDPVEVCNRHGADAVRMYMCNSPVVRAEPLRFTEDGVKGVVKDVFLPLYNAYAFMAQEVTRYEGSVGKFVVDLDRVKSSDNLMDTWILAANHGLIDFIRTEMEGYRLYTVVYQLVTFLDDLTNWYVRLNRDRMRGRTAGHEGRLTSLCTLYTVLLNVTVCLAPVTPFITEFIYQNLAKALPDGHPMKAKSVHFVMIPDPDPEAQRVEIITAVERMRAVMELGRVLRARRNWGAKKPIRTMTIANQDPAYINDLRTMQQYIQEELNVLDVVFDAEQSGVQLAPTLNFKVVAKRVTTDMPKVQAAVKELTQEELASFSREGQITVCGHVLTEEDMTLTRQVRDTGNPNLDVIYDDHSIVILDFTWDEELAKMALSREISRRVQQLRKDSKFLQDDPVDQWVEPVKSKQQSGRLRATLNDQKDYIEKQLGRPLWLTSQMQGHEMVIVREEFEIEEDDDKVAIVMTLRAPFFNPEAMRKLTGGDETAEQVCRQWLHTFDLRQLAQVCKDGSVTVTCDGKSYTMKYKEHFVIGPAEAEQSWLQA